MLVYDRIYNALDNPQDFRHTKMYISAFLFILASLFLEGCFSELRRAIRRKLRLGHHGEVSNVVAAGDEDHTLQQSETQPAPSYVYRRLSSADNKRKSHLQPPPPDWQVIFTLVKNHPPVPVNLSQVVVGIPWPVQFSNLSHLIQCAEARLKNFIRNIKDLNGWKPVLVPCREGESLYKVLKIDFLLQRETPFKVRVLSDKEKCFFESFDTIFSDLPTLNQVWRKVLSEIHQRQPRGARALVTMNNIFDMEFTVGALDETPVDDSSATVPLDIISPTGTERHQIDKRINLERVFDIIGKITDGSDLIMTSIDPFNMGGGFKVYLEKYAQPLSAASPLFAF
jgi:hypothetical protein